MANRAQYETAVSRGLDCIWEQNWEQAIKEFSHAISIVSNEPSPYDGLGTSYLELGDLRKALDNFKLAARYSRGDIIYLRRVADVQEKLGYDEEAGKTYMAIGEVELSRRKLNDAMDNWLRAIRLEPNLLRAHQRLASVYKRQGSAHSAIRSYLEIARILQREGQREQAVQAAQSALEMDPRNKDVLTAIEMLKQGRPIAGAKTQSDPVQKMEEAFKLTDEADSAMDTVSPVQDARRAALEQLAEVLFSDTDSDPQQDALISQALSAQTDGKINEAIGYYEKAIASGMSGAATHFNLGVLYQDKLRFEDAIKQFEQSVKDANFRLASHFALGESHRARGRIEEAVEHFITVLKIVDLGTVQHDHSDRLIELYENLADSLVTKGEREQATNFANALVDFLSHKGWEDKVKEARTRLNAISNADMMILGDVLTSGNEQVLESLYLAQEYTRRGMYDTAIEESFRAIQLSPDYLPAHLQLAETFSLQGRRDASAYKYSTIAKTYQVRGDINGSILAYEKVTQLTPLDLKLRTQLIDLLKQHGQIDKALQQYIDMGEAHYQLAQLDKARESYQEGLRLASRGPSKYKQELLRRAADIDMQRFDWRRALPAYKELRQIDPDNERVAITLVDLYFKVGQPNNAINMLDQYLIYLVRQKKGNKVIGILEDMVQKRPFDANLADRLFKLYVQRKQRDQAVNLLDKLAESQLEEGNRAGAIKTVERLIKLKPPQVAAYRQFLTKLQSGG